MNAHSMPHGFKYPTLGSQLWASPSQAQNQFRNQVRDLGRNLMLAIGGTLLLTLSAKVQIPFYPVPLTMQTFVVLLIGFAYGWKLGALTVLLYLAQGAIGLPVFAATPQQGLGFAYMMGPTGGYLAGFVVAAAACGYLAERGWDRRVSTTCAAMLVGNLIMYAAGLLWLGALLGWEQPILQWGLYPFLLGDALKIALAMWVLPSVWKARKFADSR